MGNTQWVKMSLRRKSEVFSQRFTVIEKKYLYGKKNYPMVSQNKFLGT